MLMCALIGIFEYTKLYTRLHQVEVLQDMPRAEKGWKERYNSFCLCICIEKGGEAAVRATEETDEEQQRVSSVD